MTVTCILRQCALACILASLPTYLLANTVFEVTLETAPLVGHPDAPFSLLLLLTDGEGTGNGNNILILDNITLGGGSALGDAVLFGGVSGSLSSGIALVDTSFLSLFNEQFAPGLSLRFLLSISLNDNPGGTPDRLTLSILDSAGVPVPTLAPAGDFFLGIDLKSAGPVFDLYGSDPARSLSNGGPVEMTAPTVSTLNPIPEPSTAFVCGAALLAIVGFRGFRARKR